MVFLLFVKGRRLLAKDSKKLFYGLNISKNHMKFASAVFLAASAESGWYARQNFPSYDHFATAEVSVLRGSGLGHRPVRIVIAAEGEHREVSLKLGVDAEIAKWHGRSEAAAEVLSLRHAEPQLRLLVFGPQKGLKGWFRSFWQKPEELLGYCQVPLELLRSGEEYEGELQVHHPISHLQVGQLGVRLRYCTDDSKVRLSYIAPRDCDGHCESELHEGKRSEEHISQSIDLMQLLTTVQSIGEKLEEIRDQLAVWWGWEHPLRSLFTSGVLILVAVRPQYAALWFHTVVSTAMLSSCARNCHPEIYAKIRPWASVLGLDAKQVDFSLDQWIPRMETMLPRGALDMAVSAAPMTIAKSPADAAGNIVEGSSIHLSSTRWLILRTAEFAGWLKPLGPLLLHVDSLLAELRRIALWEEPRKAAAVTAASMVLGLTSSFVRIAKMRPTSWISGALGLSVLATAPWMASGGTLKGSWAYFSYSLFGLGCFPKLKSLDDVNAIKPWHPSFHSANAWKAALKP